jgi:nifR3 family TIM-barrel protein
MPAPRLTDPWMLGPLHVPNRVMLAPLAGIGNWFVRLQAKRYGAGMAVSEMVSSHAIHYRNEKTCNEMLRIDPRERHSGPVSIQLFGDDPAIMHAAAAHVAAIGADAIDINMGCPVAKVQKAGAGAALLADPDRAVELALAAVQGARDGAREAVHGARDGAREAVHGARDGAREAVHGASDAARARGRSVCGPPVTVKLRSGLRPGDESGFQLAHRLVEEAGVAAIAFHPRSASVQHKGRPDYELARRLVSSLPAPVILTGGLSDAQHVRDAFLHTRAAAVMLARGALGNPWLFAELLHGREERPSTREVLDELDWTIDRAVEHLGEPRATRYLRKFYPWYLARLDLQPTDARRLGAELQSVATLAQARSAVAEAPLYCCAR